MFIFSTFRPYRWQIAGFLLLSIAGVLYLITAQSIPNGSSDPYMIDVGETQVALNVWGVLHLTGYPLYTMLGNLLVAIPQVFGASPALAASLVSAFWSLIALLMLVRLCYFFDLSPTITALCLLILTVTQSIWVHSVVAEVYSLSLAFLALLWWLAAHPTMSLRKKFWLLALVGGAGIAHHRAVAFSGLGLVWILLPELRLQWRQVVRWMPTAIGLFLIGFLPYLYIPLRANAEAEWLYADNLDTWDGFWFLFWGREADYLVTTPSDLAGWIDNFTGTIDILARELTPLGLMIGLGLWALAGWKSPHQKLFQMVSLSGAGFLAFAIAYHRAVLPEAILMMALPSLAICAILALDWLTQTRQFAQLGLAAALMLGAIGLGFQHGPFVDELTTDETGLRAIDSASAVPRSPIEEPVFMLSWGPRYFAASYSRLVTEENRDLAMVDHTADFAALAQDGKTIYTQPDTLFGYPLNWWADRIGPVYLTSAAFNLVRLATEPRLPENIQTDDLTQQMADDIWLAGYELRCTEADFIISAGWYAEATPAQNLSVKVHLRTADEGRVLANADVSAPVYGWRNTQTWLAGELVADHYRLPRLAGGERIVLGFYEALPDGSFENYDEFSVKATCP